MSINEIAIKPDREQFIEQIKKWVVIDEQLKIVNDKTKKLREMKNSLSNEICNYVDTNNITNKITITDGELTIFEKKEYSSLTYNYIEKCLAEIIGDKRKVEYIISYLKENREIKINKDIRRTNREKTKNL